MNERDFKGIWIPKEIWTLKELSIIEKVMLVEINSLDNEKGCFAGNEYFAEFFEIGTVRVSQIIGHLKELGYLIQESFDGRRRVLKTSFKINFKADLNESLSQNDNKVLGRVKQNDKYNNTVNNKNNNTFNLEIPIEWNSKEFFDLWNEFVEIRNKKHRPLSVNAANLRYQEIFKHSNGNWEIAKLIMRHTNDKAYDKFFPLKNYEIKEDVKENYDKWK